MIEEIIGLFIIPIIAIVIISSLIYLILPTFKAISYKNSLLILISCLHIANWHNKFDTMVRNTSIFSREQVVNDIDYAIKVQRMSTQTCTL